MVKLSTTFPSRSLQQGTSFKTALPLNFCSTPSNIYKHMWHLIVAENNLGLNLMENFWRACLTVRCLFLAHLCPRAELPPWKCSARKYTIKWKALSALGYRNINTHHCTKNKCTWLVQRRGHKAKQRACPCLCKAVMKRPSPRSLQAEDEALRSPTD